MADTHSGGICPTHGAFRGVRCAECRREDANAKPAPTTNLIALAADLRYWRDRTNEHRGRNEAAYCEAVEAASRASAQLSHACLGEFREEIAAELARRAEVSP